MAEKTVTWKQVQERGCLGAFRGQGIFLREMSKHLGMENIIIRPKRHFSRPQKESEIRQILEPL
jgi:hypothetical protein